MSPSKSKVGKSKKRPKGKVMIFSIGSTSLSCVAGPMGTRNVTVGASGVAAPLGSPATCTATGVTAALSLNGNPVNQQQMTLVSAGNYVTTFYGMPPGAYSAIVSVTWQIMLTETATVAANCP